MAFQTLCDTSRLFSATATPAPRVVPYQPALPPRLCFFISRSNGTCVPLIPADELPYSVRLQDVPRVMSVGETCGMQHVGTLPYTGQYFRPEKNIPQRPSSEPTAFDSSHTRSQSTTSSRQFFAPDALVRAGLIGQPHVASFQTPTSHPMSSACPRFAEVSASNWRKPVADSFDSTQLAIDAIIASNAETAARTTPTSRTSTPPSGSAPDQQRKVYCTHWIRHGECDYTQQGCLYKHEMPDRATLESIGFRAVPRWYLEKTAPRLQGMSSLPTVGAPMKATEWLKRRSSSCSDADDESEGSESEQESEGDGKEARKNGFPTAEKIAFSEKMDKSATEDVSMPTPPKTPRLFDGIRKLSFNDNLIDFSPLLPTPSSSDCSTAVVRPADSSSSTLCQSSESSPKERSPNTSPRKTQKVFVPAGESPEYHITQARDRARSAEQKSRQHTELNRQTKTARNRDSHSRIAIVQSSVPPKKVQIVQRPILSGLMASKHAPRVDSNPPAVAMRTTLAMRPKPVTANAPLHAAKALPSSTARSDRETHAYRSKPVCRVRRPAGSASSKAKASATTSEMSRKQGAKTAKVGE